MTCTESGALHDLTPRPLAPLSFRENRSPLPGPENAHQPHPCFIKRLVENVWAMPLPRDVRLRPFETALPLRYYYFAFFSAK